MKPIRVAATALGLGLTLAGCAPAWPVQARCVHLLWENAIGYSNTVLPSGTEVQTRATLILDAENKTEEFFNQHVPEPYASDEDLIGTLDRLPRVSNSTSVSQLELRVRQYAQALDAAGIGYASADACDIPDL